MFTACAVSSSCLMVLCYMLAASGGKGGLGSLQGSVRVLFGGAFKVYLGSAQCAGSKTDSI